MASLPANPPNMRGRAEFQADTVVALLFCAAWAITLILFQIGMGAASRSADLIAVYLASGFYADGLFDQVYAFDADTFFAVPSQLWRDGADIAGFKPDADLFPYIYPPIWAALLAPVAKG